MGTLKSMFSMRNKKLKMDFFNKALSGKKIKEVMIYTLLLSFIASVSFAEEKVFGINVVREEPEITDEILLNPGMGLFISLGEWNLRKTYENAWFIDLAPVVYIRLDWALLEPEERKYKFDEVLDPVINYWLSRGKRVAFRIMSSNQHSTRKYVTPKWVFDAGVPGVKFRGYFVTEQIDPPFWHPVYIEKRKAFIRAFGKKYNGMKGIEFVDIGAVGEWGESHLMRWSTADLKKYGYTPMVYTKAYMEFIDAYREAFPDTPVVLNCYTAGAGYEDAIVDYAVSKGIWLRQDGLIANYQKYDHGKKVSQYYRKYFQRVKMLYEPCYSYANMAKLGMSVMDTFKSGLEDPISYLNIWSEELLRLDEKDREAVRYAARNIGYRLAPIEVIRPEAIYLTKGISPRTFIKIIWQNLGSAPCYENLAVEFTLCSKDGKEVFRTLEIPNPVITQWLPKEKIETFFVFTLPDNIAPGKYIYKIALVSLFDENERILLPLKGKDALNRYPVATIEVLPRKQPLSQPTIPGGDFEGEDPLKGWRIAKGMKAIIVSEDAPEGKQCLRLEGTSEDPWFYALSPLIPLLPFSEYRLRAKMKVIEVDGVKVGDKERLIRWRDEPYFKIGLYDAQKRWFSNQNTQRYDVIKMGWQELECRFTTDDRAAFGQFAVEKGTKLPRQAIILIDDVRLELLAAP